MRILRPILSIVVGWIAGSVINFGFVKIGHILIPLEGVDLEDMDALAELMPTLGAEYFIFPFLAHALGTLFGSMTAARIAKKNKMRFAFIISGLFFIGGIIINFIITGPAWFLILDLVVAYIPMGWLGGKLGSSKS